MRGTIGGLLGGLVLYLIELLFWRTPLSGLALSRASDAQNGAVQQALAANLTPAGSGTYVVPDPATAGGTILFGRGPVALVHFNTSGASATGGAPLIGGLILALAVGLIVGLALQGIAARSRRFDEVLRAGVLMALAVIAFLDFGQPLAHHLGWGYFIYAFVTDWIAFSAAVAVIAWFATRGRSAEQG